MGTRPLPDDIPTRTGSAIDARAYLRQAVAVLGNINLDALTEDGRVAYAQALALIAIGANSRRSVAELEDVSRILSAHTGRV